MCDCATVCFANVTETTCSPDEEAEFKLVSPAFQRCGSITSDFNRATWHFGSRKVWCDVDSPCGRLAPYIRNTRPEQRMCGEYQEKFKYVIGTFHSMCRDYLVAKLSGDNGLLQSLKSPLKPTPAPTSRPIRVETPEPIPNPVTPVPLGGRATPSSPPTPPSTTKATTTPSTPTVNDNNADANSKTASEANAIAMGGNGVWLVAVVGTAYTAWTA